MSAALQLAYEKLKDSGLDEINIQTLCMSALTAEETVAIGPNFAACPSVRINYMDPANPTKFLRHVPGAPPFFRVRYLGPTPPKDVKGKAIRYMQPGKIGLCAYFPPIIDWAKIIDDTSVRIYITEGEFKAAKACAMGFPTIGLGGANSSTSFRTGFSFLPELDRIKWSMREVFIVFDNDGDIKPTVVLGTNTFAKEMEKRGGIPFSLRLPEPAAGKKVGLDDYFLTHTAADFAALCETRESMTLAQELWKMNTRFVKICTPNLVYNMHTEKSLAVPDFKAHYNNMQVPAQVMDKRGLMSRDPQPLADKWLTWPLRVSTLGLTYAPGQPRFMESDELNSWLGWGVESKKGDVKPFLKLLNYMFGDTPEGRDAQRWLLQWCAYPIQHPGAKLYSAVVVWSALQGVGKSVLAYTLGYIYGENNWREVGQKDLIGNFSSWAKNKQFIVGNEITGSDSREVIDQIKALVTSPRVRINEKYIPEYELPNVCNIMLNSNRPGAVLVEDEDRRFWVWEVTQKAPKEFWDEYDVWYRNMSNISAVRHYLESLDLTGFSPTAAPPMTQAKEAMIKSGHTSSRDFANALRSTPDYWLRVGSVIGKGYLFTSRELLPLLLVWDPKSQVKAKGLAEDLKAVGFKQLKQLRWGLPGLPETQDCFWVIRNEDVWLKANNIKIKKHLVESKQHILNKP